MSSPVDSPLNPNSPHPHIGESDAAHAGVTDDAVRPHHQGSGGNGLQLGYPDDRADETSKAESTVTTEPGDAARRRDTENTLSDRNTVEPPTRIDPAERPASAPPVIETAGPVAVRSADAVPTPDRATVMARERQRFGGMKLGAAFFGWLTATGLAVLLLAVLAAAGVAFGVTNSSVVNDAVQQANQATGTAKTVGLIGAIVLLVILFLAYYAGGYVAGRMARFDGFKQGLGVWLWAIITTGVIAAAAAIAGSKYNILANLNLPRIPVNEGSVTTVGVIAIAAAVIAALLGALLGGKVGTRYHRKVDAAGYLDD